MKSLLGVLLGLAFWVTGLLPPPAMAWRQPPLSDWDPVAVTPVVPPTLSQWQTKHPKAYCGPVALVMGWYGLHPEVAPTSQEVATRVDETARRLSTSPTEGTELTRLLMVLAQMRKWPQKSPVFYRGIHRLGPMPNVHVTSALPHWEHIVHALRHGAVVVGHFGWYRHGKTIEAPWQREGGHYVLLVGAYRHKQARDRHLLALKDPLIRPLPEGGWSQPEVLRLEEGLPVGTVWLSDPLNQFAARGYAAPWVGAQAFPSKPEDFMPVLEGIAWVAR
jgi:hypothetical protein